jgi:hypothetical protein
MWDVYPMPFRARVRAVCAANLDDSVVLIEEVEENVVGYHYEVGLSRIIRRIRDGSVVVLRDFQWRRVDVEDRVVDFTEAVAE